MYVFCVCYNKYNKKMQQCLRKLYKPKVIAFMTVCSVLAAFHFSQQLTKYYGDVTVV